jgi:hypothetical protein
MFRFQKKKEVGPYLNSSNLEDTFYTLRMVMEDAKILSYRGKLENLEINDIFTKLIKIVFQIFQALIHLLLPWYIKEKIQIKLCHDFLCYKIIP